MKNNTCVYFHKRLDTNEVFYVGIGSPKRPYSKNDRSKWWKYTVNKAGYEVIIYDKGLSWSNACKLEIALISFFGRRNLGKGTLVNLTDGGDGVKGHKHSSGTKAKLSAAHKGKKFSEEHKAKLSKSRQGEKGSNAILTEEIVTEIIYQLKFHYCIGMVNDLAKKYGVSHETIYPIKNNRTWKHIDRDSILLKEGDAPTSSKTSRLAEEIVREIIYQCKFHYYYGMLKDLAKQYGVRPNTISDIKNNKRWKHIDRNLIIKKT